MELFDSEEKSIDSILEEKFQLFENNEKAPEGLKKEVFSSLDMIDFAAEFAGLFTVKFAQTGMNIIDAAINPTGGKTE